MVSDREVTYQIHMEVRDKGTKPSPGDMPGVFGRVGCARVVVTVRGWVGTEKSEA